MHPCRQKTCTLGAGETCSAVSCEPAEQWFPSDLSRRLAAWPALPSWISFPQLYLLSNSRDYKWRFANYLLFAPTAVDLSNLLQIPARVDGSALEVAKGKTPMSEGPTNGVLFTAEVHVGVGRHSRDA